MELKSFSLSLLFILNCMKASGINNASLWTNNLPDACGSNGVCNCYYDEWQIFCLDINLTEVPGNIPSTTSQLLLDDNLISQISASAFRGLPFLETLSLSHNIIVTIENGSFNGLFEMSELSLSDNELTKLPAKLFRDMLHLTELDLCCNELTNLPAEIFAQLRYLTLLDLSYNKLEHLPKRIFDDLESLETMNLEQNKITFIDNGCFRNLSNLNELLLQHNMIDEVAEFSFQGLVSVLLVDLRNNRLPSLPTKAFNDLRETHTLMLSNNVINFLQKDTFTGLVEAFALTLGGNNISSIASGFFSEIGYNVLQVLFLQHNKLTVIHKDVFEGLEALRFLCLYGNQIHTIEDNAFSMANLENILLFQNDLTNITGNEFSSNSMEQVHLYGNKISYIEQQSLLEIPTNTSIYISCESLDTLPVNRKHKNLKCVNSFSLPWIYQESDDIMYTLLWDGFRCNTTDTYECTPCGPGTHADRVESGCKACPRGGFYQDEIAQTLPSDSHWDIPCKLCNVGTYVIEGNGRSPEDCVACPEGTNKSIDAGFRACYCKENYARKDRYGPCYVCFNEGLSCNMGYESLKPGFMWNWSFPDANVSNYKAFAANLEVDYDPLDTTPDNYTGEIPNVFECPRRESCDNSIDRIQGNCEKGYMGWLCTNCEPGFYSVLNACVPCPSLVFLIIESCVFFLFCALACFALTTQIKRKHDKEQNARTAIDIVIARIKILLGFYQVVGEIFTSLHDIRWTGPLEVMGRFISAFEINILRLFIRPRCFDVKLDLDPKVQFIIGAVSPVVIVTMPFMFYQAKKLYVLIRYTPSGRLSFRSHFENLKAYSFACVVVLLFVIYPPVCTVIFSLYPMSCKTFSLDKGSKHKITRLRSDYDVDCNGLKAFHMSAFILTATYVIAFPAALFGVLCRYYFTRKNKDSPSEELPYNYIKNENESLIINSPPHTQTCAPTWLSFLTENYKENFWFWEIVELARKVTQTLLITLFGWEDRLTVIITTCISVVYLLLHARYLPMKSSYEQALQIFSLTVIFINVVVAANDFPEEHTSSISSVLVLLNLVVLVIIAVEMLVAIIAHIKHLGILKLCTTSCKTLKTSTENDEDLPSI